MQRALQRLARATQLRFFDGKCGLTCTNVGQQLSGMAIFLGQPVCIETGTNLVECLQTARQGRDSHLGLLSLGLNQPHPLLSALPLECNDLSQDVLLPCHD